MKVAKSQGATRAPSLLRKSSAGYEFDENSDEWMLDGSITIKLGYLTEFGLEEKTAEGFRKSLSCYAQDLSSRHCANVSERTKHFFKVTKANSFSVEALSTYRATLDEEHIWYLGALRGFLDSWHEWNYLGISAGAIDYLDGLTIKGNEKGVAVLTNCPYSGPYTSMEHESMLFGLANAYASQKLSQYDYSFLLSISMTGQRPIQIRHLKLCDLSFEDMGGTRGYYLNVPRAKQRGGGTFRIEFKRIQICKDLFDALNDQQNDVIDRVKRTLGSLDKGAESLLPLFPEYERLAEYEPSTIESYLNNDLLHLTTGSVSNLRFRVNATVKAHSERTGDQLIIGFTRLRRTFATNLAAEGFGPLVIADALGHSDTQQVGVYARPENETAKFVDAALAPVLAPLAMAFAGILIKTERDALRGNDPHSRIKLDSKTDVGSCGSFGFCIDGWKSCYVCKNFQPWLNGPHEQARDDLLFERQEQLDRGVSPKVIGASDRTLLAITQVIQMCERTKAEMDQGPAGEVA